MPTQSRQVAVVIIVLVLVAATAYVLVQDRDDVRLLAALSESRSTQTAGNSRRRVDLSHVFVSSWDRLWFFAPYTSEAVIQSSIGCDAGECRKLNIGESDSQYSVVLTFGNQIVSSFCISVGDVDFHGVHCPAFVRRSQPYVYVSSTKGRPSVFMDELDPLDGPSGGIEPTGVAKPEEVVLLSGSGHDPSPEYPAAHH